MNITLYQNKSGSNVINKTLENPLLFENCKMKQTESIIKPTLILSSNSNLTIYNYCYIDVLKRYYFINNISVTPNNLYTIETEVDTLSTYKTYINTLITDNIKLSFTDNFNHTPINVLTGLTSLV